TVTDFRGASYTIEQAGAWSVPAPEPNRPPRVLGLERSQTGNQETLTATFADPDGYGHLASLDVRIGNPDWSCGFRYNRSAHTIQMLGDDGSTWMAAIPAASTLPPESATCLILPWALGVSGSNQTLILRVAVQYKKPMPADASVWLAATDRAGASTGWVRQ
ncbi:MAG: hypothetical protein N2036_10005, partial [Bryobacteraceae bacterium]|nr:hypothetical protein [Bryobacteraceae bacterium]